MMFKHGFVHCDPHAANLINRASPSRKSGIFGRRRPQLVLLDHGLYKELDISTRTNYAALWKELDRQQGRVGPAEQKQQQGTSRNSSRGRAETAAGKAVFLNFHRRACF